MIIFQHVHPKYAVWGYCTRRYLIIWPVRVLIFTADLLKYYILIWNFGYIIQDYEVVWAFVFCYGCVNKTWMLLWNVKKSLLWIAHTNVRLLNDDEKCCSKVHCIVWIHPHILSTILVVLAILRIYLGSFNILKL